jgi:hypothetical protein
MVAADDSKAWRAVVGTTQMCILMLDIKLSLDQGPLHIQLTSLNTCDLLGKSLPLTAVTMVRSFWSQICRAFIKAGVQAHRQATSRGSDVPGAYPKDQTMKAKGFLGWDHVHTKLFFVGRTLSVAFAFAFDILSSNSPLTMELIF